MPQRKQITWAQLRVGLLTLVALFLIMVAILYVTTGANIWGAKYQLHTFLPEVEQLTLGAPVRLDGVEVGNVDAIRIAPRTSSGTPDRNRNIEVIMRVDKRFQPDITEESRVSLVTEGFLGNRYVRITRGYGGKPIAPQGEVIGNQEVAMKDVVERGADLVENLGALSKDVQSLVGGLRKGQGSLGKLMTDDQLYQHANATVARMDRLLERTESGQNTLGKLMADDEVYRRINSAAERLDKLLASVQDEKGTLGKLVNDPALYQDARDFVAKANAFMADVRAGKGTLGKLSTDEKLYDNLRDSAESLKEITDKLSRGSGSMAKAVNDPQLYDNLTGLSADLRLLIADFRQDPKKYLHVKFSIF